MIYPAAWLLISLLTFDNVGRSFSRNPFDDGHIQWRFSSLKQSQSEWKLVFTAVIDRGWHLYSQSIEEGGPMPTSFSFDKSDGLKLLGDVVESGDAKHVFDSTFVMDVVWYEGQVVFTQNVKAGVNAVVTGRIDYSVCSEEKCIPGSTRFAISLKDR